jgi:hypothetical protein
VTRDREHPGTTTTWLLLVSPEEARVLPRQGHLWGTAGLLDAGNRLVAWVRETVPEEWARLWACPRDKLADVPVEALPMFLPEAPEAGVLP